MFELKKLSSDGIAAALEKAHRYRLLNEPWEAESICRDVLEVAPGNKEAIVTLLLAITDRFVKNTGGEVSAARKLLDALDSEYERLYYAGIICERRGKSIHAQSAPGSGPVVYEWLREAMDHFAAAERVRPPGNDDAILRWNTCARMIDQHHDVRPAPVEPVNQMLE